MQACPWCSAQNDPGEEVCFKCGKGLSGITEGSLLGGRYEIQSRLGRGGMGVVYKALDRELDELVAIKVLRSDVTSPDLMRRFRSEIKLARRVTHRNVCRIHEFGRDANVAYIVMEYLDGVDFKRLLREKGPLPAAEAYDVAIQIAEGLAEIHREGIIHRDLKTPNIMRDARGGVKLMDFGIAKSLDAATQATATGQIIGTPEYMSPEQARAASVDARSDIYALGVVTFELFVGEVPLRGDTPIATLFRQMQDAPPLDNPRLPEALVPVLKRALAKTPDDRFPTARIFSDALRAAREATLSAGAETPPPAPTVSSPLRAPDPAPATTPLPTPVPTAVKTATPTYVPTVAVKPAPVQPPDVPAQPAAHVEVPQRPATFEPSTRLDATPRPATLEPPARVAPTPAEPAQPAARVDVAPPPATAEPSAPVDVISPSATPEPSTRVDAAPPEVPAQPAARVDAPSPPKATAQPTEPVEASPPRAGTGTRRLPAIPRPVTAPPAIARRPRRVPLGVGIAVVVTVAAGVVLWKVASMPKGTDGTPREAQADLAVGLTPAVTAQPTVPPSPSPEASPARVLPTLPAINPSPAEAMAARTPRPTTRTPAPATALVPETRGAATPGATAAPRPTSAVPQATPSPTAIPPVSATPVKAGTPEPAHTTSSGPAPVAEARAATPAGTPAESGVGTLAIRTKPTAAIAVDGRFVGKEPAVRLTLAAGVHQITFDHPDYLPHKRTVTIRAGQVLDLNVDLRDEAIRRKR